MAEFTRRTILANPARSVIMPKRRKFTPAQIAAGFGGKRRKAAVTRTSTKRRNPDDNFQKHLDAARLKRWKADKKAEKTAKAKRVAVIAAKRKPLRSNPGDIITLALANPSATRNTKGHTTTMARRKKRSTTAVTPTRRRRITTRRRTRKNPVQVAHRRRARRVAAPRRRASSTRRRTRRNPSIPRGAGGIGSVVQQGMWAIGGAVASKLLTQALLGASNTGFMGYGGNLASAFALGAVMKMLLRNNQAAGNAVILGGVIQTLLRVLIDKTPFGSRVSNLGMGDYMAQNYLTPQRLVDGLNSAQLAPPVMPVAAAPAGMSGIYGGSLY